MDTIRGNITCVTDQLPLQQGLRRCCRNGMEQLTLVTDQLPLQQGFSARLRFWEFPACEPKPLAGLTPLAQLTGKTSAAAG